MSEASKSTNYIMTCIDGTTFELPVDVPVWSDELQALTIGGVEVDAIYRDPSLMPDDFRSYEVEKVREVSEVDEVPPGRDVLSELDGLRVRYRVVKERGPSR